MDELQDASSRRNPSRACRYKAEDRSEYPTSSAPPAKKAKTSASATRERSQSQKREPMPSIRQSLQGVSRPHGSGSTVVPQSSSVHSLQCALCSRDSIIIHQGKPMCFSCKVIYDIDMRNKGPLRACYALWKSPEHKDKCRRCRLDQYVALALVETVLERQCSECKRMVMMTEQNKDLCIQCTLNTRQQTQIKNPAVDVEEDPETMTSDDEGMEQESEKIDEPGEDENWLQQDEPAGCAPETLPRAQLNDPAIDFEHVPKAHEEKEIEKESKTIDEQGKVGNRLHEQKREDAPKSILQAQVNDSAIDFEDAPRTDDSSTDGERIKEDHHHPDAKPHDQAPNSAIVVEKPLVKEKKPKIAYKKLAKMPDLEEKLNDVPTLCKVCGCIDDFSPCDDCLDLLSSYEHGEIGEVPRCTEGTICRFYPDLRTRCMECWLSQIIDTGKRCLIPTPSLNCNVCGKETNEREEMLCDSCSNHHSRFSNNAEKLAPCNNKEFRNKCHFETEADVTKCQKCWFNMCTAVISREQGFIPPQAAGWEEHYPQRKLKKGKPTKKVTFFIDVITGPFYE